MSAQRHTIMRFRIVHVRVSLVYLVLTSLFVLTLLFVSVPAAQAHQFTPGYLEINAQADGTAEIAWKVPLIKGRRMNITPVLPESCQALTPQATYALSNAVLESTR